ncbi:hypothetical protein GCM10027451_14730 [Geodermatophilus aquaeductus]|uniref:Peptidase propeptide and YPEB domain-containing protein n=1 Tax=Geodermatophilus aquaeductus TaxID=1564161 RepID=A0A521BHQ9_9ACTN|nr:hypothetical protein [Geodermatophilus aquaeductus]SMO46613.1 hypothetical protein SAMN06273567_101768 [Geodermatophilus aquaeductus]
MYRSTETVGRHAWVRTPRRTLPPELTADVAVEVAAAALADHPGATIEWLEVDGAGLFEAHLRGADGQTLVVHLDGDLRVVGWLSEVS